jgi:hypothetical protein
MQRFKKILFVREENTTATSTPRRAVQLARKEIFGEIFGDRFLGTLTI